MGHGQGRDDGKKIKVFFVFFFSEREKERERNAATRPSKKN